MLPLLAGLAELGFFVVHGRPATAAGQIQAFVPGFLLIMIGLVIAGPWLTMTGARIMARRASRPSALIAARRLADNPRAAFRAVSGLVLALFITTVAVAGITTQDAKEDHPIGWASAANVLVDDQAGQPLPAKVSRPAASVADGPGAGADAGPAAGPAEQDPRRRERDRGSRGRQVDPAQSAAWRKRPWAPLGISADRPRSRRPGLVLRAGPRSRPRPLPRRGGSRVLP